MHGKASQCHVVAISVFDLATKMTRNACELTAAFLYNCFKNISKWFIKFFKRIFEFKLSCLQQANHKVKEV